MSVQLTVNSRPTSGSVAVVSVSAVPVAQACCPLCDISYAVEILLGLCYLLIKPLSPPFSGRYGALCCCPTPRCSSSS